LNLIPTKTPFLVKKFFSKYIWDIPTKEKALYLTFDDGPTPKITDWTLDILKQYNAKATFFCIGNNIEKHPEIFQRIEKEGHAFGNHTFNHPSGWKTKTEDYISEVQKTEQVMSSEIRVQNEIERKNSSLKTHHSKLFRPPYGKITTRQGKSLIKLGYKIIMWDVLALDWMDSVSPEECYKNVISNATNGSVIVFHDSAKAYENMQYAFPKVLEYFSKKDFEFKCIPE
jgi:peptidoglycan/xylan/chitin deacetylase (PgdA/CDA1 family)